MNIKSAIFDLDGTLIDSKTGIVNGLKNAFSSNGLVVPENIDIPVGPPLHDTILSIFPNIEENMIKKITESFRDAYHKFDLPVSKPFSGAINMLKILKNTGIEVYIATYKPKIFSQKILEKYFKNLYKDVVTPTELPSWVNIYQNNCTKTDIVRFLVDKHKIDCLKCIMAGDTISDIEAARKNNIVSIAANYGYGSNLTNADFQANSIYEVFEIITNYSSYNVLEKNVV